MGIPSLYLNQRDIIYCANDPVGSRTQIDLPSDYGMSNYEQVKIVTKDKLNLDAYLIKKEEIGLYTNTKSRIGTTILFLHGNAGNMGHRLPIARILYNLFDCNILMLSYRGYGRSEGSPSEKGLKMDVDAAMEFLKQNPTTKNTKIVVYGQSIGGAVAIDTAYRYKEIDAMIVENTFTSLPDVVECMFPYVWFIRYFIKDSWASKNKIGSISVPMLFLSGRKDSLVPPKHMLELVTIARNNGGESKVTFKEFENGNHNDTCTQFGYFESIQSWWENLGL
ncbi:hypothetical protein BB559_001295 [Furculomyces boomerangus]|uniref:AB hydrolase-1 domain-containing protein n=2 Tax=Harpellales TaxID=61421 RepID=A0A2T9Z2K6_9FUNG|nr:hypothetical protein BB559_001295 [Furculomyces boomerangus]PWA01796.1 hypothetical protein BB558_002082 [Smittium angustum]